MGDIRNVSKSGKARNRRIIKLAPMTRAVRSALAVSALTLGIGLTGNVSAANHRLPATMVHALQTERPAIDFAPVFDLTTVPQALIGTDGGVQSIIGDGTTPAPPIGFYYEALGDLGWSLGFDHSYSGVGDVHAVHVETPSGSSQGNTSVVLTATSSGGEAVALYVSASTTNYHTNSGALTANGYTDAAGIAAFGGDDVTVVNSGTIDVTAQLGNAYGILGASDAGDVGISNANDISVYSHDGMAIGIYGYGAAGNVSVGNSGAIDAYSYNGLADGIFASGANVDVTNSGGITAEGYTWATGIEARGNESSTVNNSGAISATANGWGGSAYGPYAAYGIYASSAYGDASVVNSGSIVAVGYYATGIRTQTYGDASITNDASINAGGTTNSALAWGIRAVATGEGAAIEIDNSGNIGAAGIYGATGIEAVSSGLGGTASVTNTGDIVVTQNLGITSYGGNGILVSADGDSTIYNDGGNVTVTSKGPAAGLVSNSFVGTASVTNTGDVSASSTLNSSANPSIGAIGIVAFAGNGDASVDNSGSVYAHGVRSGTGIYAGAGADGNVTVTNSGDIVAVTNLATNARADGIKVAAGGGNIEVENSGSIYASGAVLAFGVYSSSASGDTHIDNTEDGYIGFYSYAGRGFGMFAFAEQGDVSIDNAGDINGYGWLQAYGARVRDLYGNATINNSGNISVESGSNKAFGLLVSATYEGTAGITNSGDIEVVSRTGSYGMRAYGYAGADVGNSGTIYAASTNGVAVGMMAQAGAGDTTVTNTGGSIEVKAATAAFGIYASSAYGNVTVSNDSEINALGVNNGATGIKATAAGDVDIANSAYIYAASNGNAFGLYGYTDAGNVTVDNSGDMLVYSVNGLADGIFAAGMNVDVANTGDITAIGSTWATGIEAEGAYATTVQNDGDILAIATGVNGQANGIYATGSTGVTIGNTGDIGAYGTYATGIEAQSQGGIAIDNSGNIIAEDDGYGLATAIHAISGGEGAAVSITNTGDISAQGYYGSTGISAVSSGTGGTASVTNSGAITVAQGNKYGYGAYGIVTSADGDSTIANSGAITVDSEGVANGVVALSFAGDASVTNSGDITVSNTAMQYYAASGIVSFSANGNASAANGGNVDVASSYWATGMNVQALGDATVENTGSLSANGDKYAFGVYAMSGTGDLSVTNGEDASIEFYSYAGRGWGVFGVASQGDVNVVNDGSVAGYAFGQSAGIFVRATAGDATVDNGGSIDVTSANGVAVGVFANGYGAATVNNAGDISAVSGVNGYAGDAAYGVLARGAYADVTNSGSIIAQGYYAAAGIFANGSEGATVTNTGGTIEVYAVGEAVGIGAAANAGDTIVSNASDISAVGLAIGATGIQASSVSGDVSIDNTGDIYAYSVLGNAIGLYGYSVYGDVSIDNGGGILAISPDGLADGIFASGMNVDVANTGDITAIGGTWATGIEAEGAYTTSVQNDGDILAAAIGVNGHANGIYATGSTGVTIANTGDISAYGTYATGIEAQSQGSIAIDNSGNIIAEDDGYGLATAIHAISGGEGAAVNITNTGDITVQSYYGASGIVAVSGGLGGTASVTNDGNIEVTQGNKYGYAAYGIVSSADGDSTIVNNGSITVTSDSPVTGAAALSFAGDASVTSSGDITVHSEAVAYYAANGIVSFAGNGHATADNSANIDVSTKYIGTGMDVNGLEGAIASSSGDISVDAWRAYGIHAQSGNGDVSVDNSGSIYATYTGTNFAGTAFGILGTSVNGNVAISNSGDIATLVQDQSVGIFGRSDHGDVSVTNDGTIYAYSADGYAVGVFARADEGAVSVDSGASIEAYSYNGYAFGVLARGDVVDVDNSGDISANGLYEATGIAASSFSGTTVTSSGGAISAFAVGAATGIDAQSAGGNVTVTNASDIEATGMVLGARGILAASGYDVAIDNSGDIAVLSMDGDATGIFGYSLAGKTSIGNSGAIEAASYHGDAIGIYGYSLADDVTINNSGDLTAASVYGLADGIFASGQDVDVTNSGAITAEGYLWAAGIEAEGSNSTQVHNSGDISASVMPFIQVEYNGGVLGSADGGQAFGIYATAGVGGAAITNSGNIMVDGGYATGIEVHSEGNLSITNSGDIAAGSGLSAYYNSGNYYAYYYGTQVATGINAASNGEGAHVVVSNSGDIAADGIFGASGITATASGSGGTVVVTNTGDITTAQYVAGGYGAFGIVASADADSGIDNGGAITVTSGGTGYGVAALSFAGDAVVVNSGDVSVEASTAGSKYYGSYGLLSFAGNGYAGVNNSGSVSVSNAGIMAAPARAVDAQGQQGVGVVNSGSLYADGKYAYGVFAVSTGGDVAVNNTADGDIGFYSYLGYGTGILGVSEGGDVAIGNAGIIAGYGYSQAVGVFGSSSTGDVDISNAGTGSIDVVSAGTAVGIFARADYGTATVVNSGDITASDFPDSDYYMGQVAYGIIARGTHAQVGNSGSILVDGQLYSAGIVANSLEDSKVVNTGGSIEVHGLGLYVGAYGYYAAGSAVGIDANSQYGTVLVANTGEITVDAFGADAIGIHASGATDVAVTSQGDITVATVYGAAAGISAGDHPVVTGYYTYEGYYQTYSFPIYSFQEGTTSVANAGDISVQAPQAGWGQAKGIAASRYSGEVTVTNSGNIDVYSGGRSYGIDASVTNGDVSVTNVGNITMLSHTDAQIGLSATAGNFFEGGGNVVLKNGGDLSIHSDYGIAVGLQAVAGSVMHPENESSSYVLNTGDIGVFGQYFAYGISAGTRQGDSEVINTGDIDVATGAYSGNPYSPGTAAGIAINTFFGGDLVIQNSGDVTVSGYIYGTGLYAHNSGQYGNVTITNGGDVSATSAYAVARGAYAYNNVGDITVNNASGASIDASGGIAAIGVHALTASGSIVVNNAGDIHAGDSDFAAAVLLGNYGLEPYAGDDWVEGTSTLNNSGTISADGTDGYAWAVLGNKVADTINNTGGITGALDLLGGNDVFNNKAGGTWDVGSTLSTDFGDGNDTLANAAGGMITLDEGQIAFGAGDDTVNNAGRINLTNSTITMGDNQSAPLLVQAFLPQAVEINAFNNSGTLKIVGDSAVDTAGGIFTNTGVIDFGNGVTTDALTLDGTLAGTGNIAVDVDFDDHSADQLLINGNVASSAVQTVNVRFTGVPTLSAMETKVDIVNVTGTSAASNFVAGQVVGYNWNGNFLSLGAGIVSTLDATNATDDVFSVGITVEGLSDGGALAATAASGAAGFLNSQVGTFRQRLGVNPYGDAGKVMSAFVRFYSDQGDVNPTHAAGNFGQGGNFAYEQTSWGREFGINANLFGNFHAGVVLGNADSRQRLTDGVGENRMNGTSFGAYATWYVPEGLYVDLSGRWMGADIRSNSAGANLQSRTRTSAVSLEAGYEWKLGGVNVVPQAQYIRTRVEDVRTFYGENLDFNVQGGTFERGRVGVEVNKTFQSGDIRWTPYGSISAIRDTGGKTAYTVGDFYGATGVSGSRTMAELGLGVQKGGLGFTLGLNWLDGGALKSFVGGQANVRYSW